ncbi:MAG: hypothetical protein J6B75_00695 [Ruminococcus sp.]|nr:hypothetical protein [Ruminococcus sp.]
MTPRDIEAYKKELMKLYSKGQPESESKNEENNTSEAVEANNEQNEAVEREEMEQNGTEGPVSDENTQQSAEVSTENDTETVTEGETVSEEQENENTEVEKYDEKAYDEGEHDSAYFPYTGDAEEAELERIISDTEPPDIDEFSGSSIVPQESLGDSSGFIIVNVRTGNEASPIVGASVIVTAVNNGRRLFIAAGQTDISGTVTELEAPAPDKIYSQTPETDVRPYSLFDISVRASGFFNARSVDVPVFSGVTSIQNFNMIPLPLGAESGDDTLTYFNQEPFFG